MIEKIVHRRLLRENTVHEDLQYWLSKSPEERIAVVEEYRRQIYGSTARLQRLLESFNVRRVEYVIVGAYALAHHGVPRFTGDLDVLVRSTPDNARRILTALNAFGFESAGFTVDDFTTPERVVQLGVPPVRVDILTSISGVSWES